MVALRIDCIGPLHWDTFDEVKPNRRAGVEKPAKVQIHAHHVSIPVVPACAIQFCLPSALEVERRALDVDKSKEVPVKLSHLWNITAGPADMVESPNGKRVAWRRHNIWTTESAPRFGQIRDESWRQAEGGCKQCNLCSVFRLCRSVPRAHHALSEKVRHHTNGKADVSVQRIRADL